MSDQQDIVQRLRERSGKYDAYDWHSSIELEAAMEIENLRAMIDAIRGPACSTEQAKASAGY